MASQEAQRRTPECIPASRSDPGVHGAFGLLAAYTAVLAFGVLENFSIEKFEATMNVVALAGFAVPYAVFRRTSRHQLRPALDRCTVAPDLPVVPKNRKSLLIEPWSSPRIIGFLEE